MDTTIPRTIFPIICDDIRQEVGGKTSLMGVYGDHIVLTKFPFTFPKLCFQVHMRECSREFDLDIYLETPDERLLLMRDFNFRAKDEMSDKRRNIVLNINRHGVSLANPGTCRLTLIFNKNEDSAVSFPFEGALRKDIH